jgi:ABC-type transport system involved in multi-copper enzyme maturation permease subunit
MKIMIKGPYLALTWRLHRGLLIFSGFFIGLIQFLIIWIFASFDYAPVLDAILKQLPPQLQLLFNEQFLNQLSLNGAAAFGFNHPLVLFNLGIIAIAIPGWQIAGEAESGILELHLAYPIKRQTLYNTLWFSCSLFLLGVILLGYVGSLLALFLKNHLDWNITASLAKIIVNLWLLFTMIMTFSLWISIKNRESGKSGMTSAAISLIFYFHFFLGSTWEKLTFSQFLNPFTYYQPQKLMFQQNSFVINMVVLGLFSLVLFLGGYRQFIRRDIP